MMKRPTAFMIVLVLAVGMLTGCLSSQGSGSTGAGSGLTQTQPTQPQPTEDVLSETIKQEIETAWLKEHGEEFGNWYTRGSSQTWGGKRYYGTYGGYTVFFAHGASMAISGKRIGEHLFLNGNGFNLYAFKDGQLHFLADVYDSGAITSDEIGELADIHRAYTEEIHGKEYTDQLYKEYGDLEPLAEEVKAEVEAAWKKVFETQFPGWFTLGDSATYQGVRYYGTYRDHVILFVPGEGTDIMVQNINGSDYLHIGSFEIYAYQNGEFQPYAQAVESGLFMDSSIDIWVEHRRTQEKIFGVVYFRELMERY